MDAASSRLERACGIHMKWKDVFEPGTMKIGRKFAHIWLEDLPNLAVECSEIKVSEFLGEKFKIGSEEFSTGDVSLEDAAFLLTPKKFVEDFPLKKCGSGISRVFLRQDLITFWNTLVDEQNTEDLKVLSAASGLGKSIYLYLIAVFARHFGIPVQYIGNAGDLLRQKVEDDAVFHNYAGNTGEMPCKKFDLKLAARKYAAMLLFMNSGTLDSFTPFHSGRPDYDFLEGVPIKLVSYYALIKSDIVLCDELRRNFMTMKPRNFLIIDGHNALWQKLGNDPNAWLPFFELYARPEWYSTMYCTFVISGSQLHEFKLPSGYEFSIEYVEPLSREEFAIWENLSDYPNLKEKRNEMIDLTGLVPRMIGILVNLLSTSGDFSFEEVTQIFKADICNSMKMRHFEYVDSLKDSKKTDFVEMLYKLFLGGKTPRITVCEDAYRDRGLLITFEDRSLQFYNSVAREILFDTFTQFYFSDHRLVKLSQKLKEARVNGFGGDEYFEELFLGLCLCFRPDIQIYSRASSRTIHFQSTAWFRFDGRCFDRLLSSIKMSCWIKFIRNNPCLDYAYVDMTDGIWKLYLIQVSVSSFPVHNRDSARLELLFEKSGETVQLASLLNVLFDEPFEVSPVYDASKNIVDFEVTDSRGVSYRDRISILYVTPLTREDAKADSAPEFVEFLTFYNFPDDMKPFIDLGREVESVRISRRQLPVKRTNFEET
ncbi:hypothetical protein GAYE_SCF26G4618 [Galdieria yellowstonensis]|uniref:Crinkler (CRN) family protein n=1 Tax=Galdieria yellowstonensis TaxID=3028027 RepID=A0AAV9IGZ1_9RHOD|nr:hypothetical protein GAYE_SCF26G4618 [Galdieria yellowstonensis]